ncbi:hypothetical protein JCGZ_01539 [Jatropha curcas]|uniref:Uncharacterized protein n=1 Tax=Jatropha curcas TaxID=180498 RepID=A0A067LL10_JATCU|nr:hypothetical protein JCGZ_01539 [Jatropha curcas]
MADDENRKNDPKVPNNLFLLSPKFELKFPPFMKFDDSIVEDREETSQKPDVVRFADPKPVTPPPLKLYNEELEKRSHPLILFPKATTQSAVKEESRIEVIGKGEAENGKQKPNFVRFPNSQPIVPPSIDVELQESSGKTHNPLIIWQVYALGGFLILKWVWARLKERNERAKKESSGDDNRSSDEYELPSYDSE